MVISTSKSKLKHILECMLINICFYNNHLYIVKKYSRLCLKRLLLNKHTSWWRSNFRRICTYRSKLIGDSDFGKIQLEWFYYNRKCQSVGCGIYSEGEGDSIAIYTNDCHSIAEDSFGFQRRSPWYCSLDGEGIIDRVILSSWAVQSEFNIQRRSWSYTTRSYANDAFLLHLYYNCWYFLVLNKAIENQ